MLNFRSFYEDLVNFAPYDYQVRVAECLLTGKNVILSVPTGAGKTWASIVPFLYAIRNGIESFPQKMIYSLPLRTLTNSIYSDVTKVLDENNFINISSRQTGEYSNDPYFEKQIIFSTIDQTLSNFLCFPLSLSQRQSNINAGSLVGSYLVFDEFHLLDPKLSMVTSLGMLQMLKNLCRVCIMTATLTDDFIRFVEEKFDFEVISIKNFPNDVENIKSLKPAENKSVKKSTTVFFNKTINASEIVSKHKNRTIVICNRVEKAQQIYTDLMNLLNENKNPKVNKENVICLHSRFFDKDRKDKEARLKQLFGKCSSENAILISTQVIEVGMDISCDIMHTEISPVNSFLQRAGRCARFENEYGEIFVYDILDEGEKIKIESDNEDDKKEIKKLNSKYLPYDKYLCNSSLTELNNHKFIDENVIAKLVNTVLKEEEKQITDIIMQRVYNKDKIIESWKDCDKKHYRETIRDIQSIEIVLLDIENLKNEKIIPWQYETISVYKWSFISWAKQIAENKIDEDDWIFAKSTLSTDSCFDFEWQDKDTCLLRQLWVDDIKNHYDVVFVDNRYFNYTEDIGFLVAVNDDNYISPLKQTNKENKPIITYKKDAFYQHNKGLLNCFETEFKPYLKFAFQELDKYWGEKIDWEYLIKIAICFHDYGKLNNSWQKIVKEFQKRKSGIDNPNEILVHTDYNEITDKELAKSCGMNKKPPHAGIGANQVYEMLYDTYSEEVAIGVANALLKHHNTETISSDSFSICNTGKKEVENLMKEYKIDGIIKYKLPKENDLGIMPKEQKEWLLYLFIVRILRLCDQKATESLEKYYTI